MQQKQIISLIVHNHPGVLMRITGLFTRRGFNIDSLTVSKTQEAEYSRMTIQVEGDDQVARQVLSQAIKVDDVKKAVIIPAEEAVSFELMLVKVTVHPDERASMHKIASTYHANIVNVGQHSMILKMTGMPEELDEMLTHLKERGVLELVRTGLTSLQAGDTCMADVQP